MKSSTRVGPILCLILATTLTGTVDGRDGFSVVKEVDRFAADHSDVLTYTITVNNGGITAVTTGMFRDDFPNEVTGCTWICSTTGGGWCDSAGGTGDIEQLITVPVGSSATISATCTFAPDPGHECAVNVAEFFTMDPDTFNQDSATTCETWVVILFDGFESGNTSSWSVAVP